MKIPWTKKQHELLKRACPQVDASADLTDDQMVEIEEVVGDYLQLHCIADDNDLTEEGLICLSIFDVLAKY